MRSGQSSLLLMSLRAMWRRKWSSLLIVLLLALDVCAAVVLQQMAVRQESARAQMVENTEIRCVVTDANGMHAEDLQMLSTFVYELTGKDGGLTAYVDRVQALSEAPLLLPENYVLRRILNFASDEDLSPLSGAVVTLYENWTEAVFSSEAAVCLVPETVAADNQTLIVQQQGQEATELTIIGTVAGGSDSVIYCPFYLKWPGSVHAVSSVHRCSFAIRDNAYLEESKAAIFEIFIEPSSTAKNDGLTYGVLVQDQVYLQTLNRIDENLKLLSLLLPLLLILCLCIGGITSYLSTKGRICEFAVMRCLGMSPPKVFLVVFEEFLALALIGGSVGFAAGYLLDGSFLPRAAGYAAGMIGVFLIGAAAAVLRVCNVNVMKLMKGAEE